MFKSQMLIHFSNATLVARHRGLFLLRRNESYTSTNKAAQLLKQQLTKTKNNKCDEKLKDTHTVVDTKDDTVKKVYIPARDYSWLPTTSNTKHLGYADVSIGRFFSGYRPYPVKPLKVSYNRNKTFHFKLKIEPLEDSLPWVTSATGRIIFNEWEHVPISVIKGLRPYVPPPTPSSSQGIIYIKSPIRVRGRTKPSLSRLLHIKK